VNFVTEPFTAPFAQYTWLASATMADSSPCCDAIVVGAPPSDASRITVPEPFVQ
jgi:hypothetical protein